MYKDIFIKEPKKKHKKKKRDTRRVAWSHFQSFQVMDEAAVAPVMRWINKVDLGAKITALQYLSSTYIQRVNMIMYFRCVKETLLSCSNNGSSIKIIYSCWFKHNQPINQ